jgi:hypothetical protein
MLRILKWFGFLLILLIVIFSLFVFSNLKDRNPDYIVDIKIKPNAESILRAGFSALPITPDVPDQWQDLNNDAQYEPDDGDIYVDGNGNGIFDAVWMAGFDNKRAANGVHDDLWARTMVIEDENTRISLTVIDAIGLFHDEFIDIRNNINPDAGIDYSIVSSTHTHEAPDLMGLWGPGFLKSGINETYLVFVKDQIIKSIEMACENLQPAKIKFAQDHESLEDLVTDTRKPLVYDNPLTIMQVMKLNSNETIGTLIGWANHPETLWSSNLLITSDFPHYVREGIEQGIYSSDSLLIEGLGGIAIYVNGAIGGLMTTTPAFPVKDPWSTKVFLEPGFDKAKSQGNQIAYHSLMALNKSSDTISTMGIGLAAKTFNLPLQNPLFKLGAALGILNRGYSEWNHMRTEIAYLTIGPASFLTYPGEVYPELVNGGIESPDGQDFKIGPAELPVARDIMKGKYKFIIGLGNDELGYIIPKSEWDEDPPYTYNEKEAPYGEINSLGPETSPIIHQEIQQIIDDYYH